MACVPSDATWSTHRWFDGDSGFFCGERACYRADLATGAVFQTDVDPIDYDYDEPIDFSYDEPTLSFCLANAECHELNLVVEGTPELSEWDGPFVDWVEVSPSGQRALAVTYGPPFELSAEQIEWGYPADQPGQFVTTFDLATGRLLTQFAVGNVDEPCASARFLDEDTVLATWTVCEGPGESSRLVRAEDGAELGVIGASPDAPAHTAGTVPMHLGDTLWAFDVGPGRVVLVHDISTGELVHSIDPGLGFELDDVVMGSMSNGQVALVGTVYDESDSTSVGVAVLDPQVGSVVRTLLTPMCE